MSLIKSYLHQIMTQMTDNIIDRDEHQEAYIQSIIDGMEHHCLCICNEYQWHEW